MRLIDAQRMHELHPDNVRWECDHKHGSTDVADMRLRCLPCHYSKTTQDRRERAGQ